MNRIINFVMLFLFAAYVALSVRMIRSKDEEIIEQSWDLKRVGWGEMQLQDEVARLYALEDSLGIEDYGRMDSLLWYRGEIDLDAIIEKYNKMMNETEDSL